MLDFLGGISSFYLDCFENKAVRKCKGFITFSTKCCALLFFEYHMFITKDVHIFHFV